MNEPRARATNGLEMRFRLALIGALSGCAPHPRTASREALLAVVRGEVRVQTVEQLAWPMQLVDTLVVIDGSPMRRGAFIAPAGQRMITHMATVRWPCGIAGGFAEVRMIDTVFVRLGGRGTTIAFTVRSTNDTVAPPESRLRFGHILRGDAVELPVEHATDLARDPRFTRCGMSDPSTGAIERVECVIDVLRERWDSSDEVAQRCYQRHWQSVQALRVSASARAELSASDVATARAIERDANQCVAVDRVDAAPRWWFRQRCPGS